MKANDGSGRAQKANAGPTFAALLVILKLDYFTPS
jgi:hypothetical protein